MQSKAGTEWKSVILIECMVTVVTSHCLKRMIHMEAFQWLEVDCFKHRSTRKILGIDASHCCPRVSAMFCCCRDLNLFAALCVAQLRTPAERRQALRVLSLARLSQILIQVKLISLLHNHTYVSRDSLDICAVFKAAFTRTLQTS